MELCVVTDPTTGPSHLIGPQNLDSLGSVLMFYRMCLVKRCSVFDLSLAVSLRTEHLVLLHTPVAVLEHGGTGGERLPGGFTFNSSEIFGSYFTSFHLFATGLTICSKTLVL